MLTWLSVTSRPSRGSAIPKRWYEELLIRACQNSQMCFLREAALRELAFRAADELLSELSGLVSHVDIVEGCTVEVAIDCS